LLGLSRLLGLSYDAPASPRISFGAASAQEWAAPAQEWAAPDYGWGVAWYPPGERGAVSVKDPASRGRPDEFTAMLGGWSRFRSTLFIAHMRGAARRIAEEDTHPFLQRSSGRHWILTHNGQLRDGFRDALDLGPEPFHEPLGHTDSEHVLSWLLWQLRQRDARCLSDVTPETLLALLGEVNRLGSLNLLLSDGVDLVAYEDAEGWNPLCWSRQRPPHAAPGPADPLLIDPFPGDAAHRTAVVVATGSLAGEGAEALAPGQMILVRRGAVTWDSAGGATHRPKPATAAAGAVPVATQQSAMMVGPLESAPAETWGSGATSSSSPGGSGGGRGAALYRVTHETSYRYDVPVEQSSHILRLRPVADRYQEVVEHRLELSPAVLANPFEDVFGNEALKLELSSPYQELTLTSRSVVRVSVPQDRPLHSPVRNTIPLVWMPWQRQMMTPYLLPPELPEVQLRELFDYAMSFVERQDYDLTETLLDMNKTVYADYAYIQGVTTVETTPFEVYATRRGVCQDFANLLICLARLLGIPARYRVGYIYTGAQYENKVQSDASHAWTELYLPWFGWQGFDPTNGCLVGRDHVRVACGRHYRDATPTSGTILRGGGTETLSIAVRVEPIDEGG
jgi:transglutaminase-like putative cysteine protease/predicted glutamine amidotransferase